MSFAPNWLQAAYSGIPHEDVNWAQLAQQWIAMRETQEQQARQQTFVYNGQPPFQPGPMYPPSQRLLRPDIALQASPYTRPQSTNHSFDYNHGMASRHTAPSPFGTQAVHYVDQQVIRPQPTYVPPLPKPQARQPLLSVDPMPPPPPGDIDEEKYGEYEPSMLDNTSEYNEPGPATTGPVPLFPPLGGQDMDYRKLLPQKRSKTASNEADVHLPFLDMQKRKSLPSWIREGLEKMEREKQKQNLEKAMREQQLLEAQRSQAASDSADPSKSKFDADDSDQSDTEADSADKSIKTSVPSPLRYRQVSPAEAGFISSEEKRAILLTLLRQWLTELLLEVSTEEIAKIAHDAFKEANTKARVLAKTSALAALSGLGGDDESSTDSENEHSDEKATTPKRLYPQGLARILNTADVGASLPGNTEIKTDYNTHSMTDTASSQQESLSSDAHFSAALPPHVATEELPQKNAASTTKSSKKDRSRSRSSSRSRSRSRERDRRRRHKHSGSSRHRRSRSRSGSSDRHRRRSRSRETRHRRR